jgi:hypothetical protein
MRDQKNVAMTRIQSYGFKKMIHDFAIAFNDLDNVSIAAQQHASNIFGYVADTGMVRQRAHCWLIVIKQTADVNNLDQ